MTTTSVQPTFLVLDSDSGRVLDRASSLAMADRMVRYWTHKRVRVHHVEESMN